MLCDRNATASAGAFFLWKNNGCDDIIFILNLKREGGFDEARIYRQNEVLPRERI